MSQAKLLVDSLLQRVSSVGVPTHLQGSNIVAFSGGVDSSLAAALLHTTLPQNSWACIGISAALPQDQLDLARDVAAVIGIPLKEVETTEGKDENYIANQGASCFHCKTHLYTALNTVASHAAQVAKGSKKQRVVLFNGTNADDRKDPTRVGLKAAENFQVASPLSEITKEEVRIAAKALGLPNWNHAASPCLRSRLAFGVPATRNNLQRVELAEKEVRRHLSLEVHHNLRVRHAGLDQAIVEIDADLMEQAALHFPRLEDEILALGFESVKLKAFRSGSMSGYNLS